MATWTTIGDAFLEPGKPVRSVDGLALRDNPIAITEGAAGAPKIQTAAITDLAVTSGKLATSERSFSGGLAEFDSVSIAYTDDFGFSPKLSVGFQMTMQFTTGGLTITSGGSAAPYTVSWRYITA